MKIDVRNRWTGDVQFTAEVECDESASWGVRLALAVKWGLENSADLRSADLSSANLSSAVGFVPERVCPLLMLRDQPGKIRAYKLVTAKGEGPFNGGIIYRAGETVSVDDADTSPTELCGRGIHVATLDWCLCEWCEGYRILVVEFEAADIAAIPTASNGKFRLHRCTVVGEKELDYKALGLLA